MNYSPTRVTTALWLTVPLFLTGCLPFGLGGNVEGNELVIKDSVYYEIRGIDDFGIPFHDIQVWLTPMEDSCAALTTLQDELADLRSEIDVAGLDATSYCDQWEALFSSAIGNEAFWLGHFRLRAEPRAEGETPVTTYLFNAEDDEVLAESPSFDADLAYYPPASFDACAEEFESSGAGAYAPTIYGAEGGQAQINAYDDDEAITVVLEPQFPNDGRGERGESSLKGESSPAFCRDSENWAISFGGEAPSAK